MLENALLMALYSKEHNVPLKFIKLLNNEIRDMTNFIHNDMGRFYTTYRYSIDDTIMVYYHENKDKDDDQLSNEITEFLNFVNEKSLQSSYTVSLIKDARRNFDERWEIMMQVTDRKLEKLKTIKDFFDGIELDESSKESIRNSFSEDIVVKSYDIEYNEFKLTTDNIKYMFNNFSTSEKLFYIEYVDSSLQSLIKVHENANKNLLDIESRSPDTVYFKYYHRGNVVDIILDIKNNNIKYSYQSESNSEVIDNIIKNVFNSFSLTNEKTLFTSGSFSIDIKNFRDLNQIFLEELENL